MRYFFRVEYDGTAYGGWQRQKNSSSIQEELEKAFSTVLRAPCSITGAGRTDAGVHARAQGAHTDTADVIDIRKTELSVNSLLPPDIAVYRLQQAEGDFHARFSAVSRRYCYSMCASKRPLLFKRVWMVFYTVDWALVERECSSLVGCHDFSAFCASGSGARHARCRVTRAEIEKRDDLMVFNIEADRFVYMMVRSLAGTLIDIGRGRIKRSISDIIASRERRLTGATAPACGLVLDNVTYKGVD